MQPIPRKGLAVCRLGLRNLIFMVRENQVLAARMDINGFTKMVLCHNGAFNQNGLERIKNARKELAFYIENCAETKMTAEETAQAAELEKYKEQFEAAMDDDKIKKRMTSYGNCAAMSRTVKKLPKDLDIFSLSTVIKPLCSQYRAKVLPFAA